MRSPSTCRQPGIRAAAQSRARVRSTASAVLPPASGKPGFAESPFARTANPARFAPAPANRATVAIARVRNASAAPRQRADRARLRAATKQSQAPTARERHARLQPTLVLQRCDLTARALVVEERYSLESRFRSPMLPA